MKAGISFKHGFGASVLCAGYGFAYCYNRHVGLHGFMLYRRDKGVCAHHRSYAHGLGQRWHRIA